MKDIYEVPRLASQAFLAWTIPEPFWHPLSRPLGRFNSLTHPKRTREEFSKMQLASFDRPLANQTPNLPAEIWANRYEERFQYLRAWRPGGWSPKIIVRGSENVISARQNGRGVIFWGSNFSFNDLVTKMAWKQLNIPVSHFSRPAHGFSTTAFGIRYLNAVRRQIEDQFLKERIMATEAETKTALQTLRNRLDRGGAVSITVGNRGRRVTTAPFLSGSLVLATGPLFLAYSTGAALLPVYTLRSDDGQFEVVIGSEISLGQGTNDDFNRAACSYATDLEQYVIRAPGQWKGWRFITQRQS